MSHDPDFHDCAAAWLDATGDDRKHRVLREILRDAPETAGEFAVIARCEIALQLAGQTQSERRQRALRLIEPSAMSRLRRLTRLLPVRVAAVIAVLAGAAWIIFRGDESGADPGKPRIAPHVQRMGAPVITRTQTVPELLPPADKEFVRRMGRFIVPEFKAMGVPLATALDILRKNIAAIDDTAVPDFSAAPEVPDDLRVHLHLRYLPVAVLVDVLAIQTGTRFQPLGKGYRITTDPKAPMPGEPRELTYQNPQIEQMPFGSGKWHGNSPPLFEFLALGLDQCLGEKPVKSVENPPGTNSGHVTASQRLHKILRRLISAGASTPPGTWVWDVKAVEMTSAEGQARFVELAGETPGRTFSDPEFQFLMRSLSQAKGVDLMTLSTLMTQPGDGANSFLGRPGSDPQNVAIMSTQLEGFLKLQGDELIQAALGLGVQDPTIQKVYPEYQSEIAILAELKRSGFGSRHPKLRGLAESIALKKQQLTEAARTFISNLKVQMEGSAGTGPDDWTGIRWTVENQTSGDSEGMFQWTMVISETSPDGSPARTVSSGHGRLFDHQSMLLHSEKMADGRLRALFITGRAISEEVETTQNEPPPDTGDLPSPPAPDSPPAPQEDLPYGIPVAGKTGFVYSPYVNGTDKLVDIAGLKRGTRVRCPFTGKDFRVP